MKYCTPWKFQAILQYNLFLINITLLKSVIEKLTNSHAKNPEQRKEEQCDNIGICSKPLMAVNDTIIVQRMAYDNVVWRTAK